MIELPEDLKLILNVGAKVYEVKGERQGKVVDLGGPVVKIIYSGNDISEYHIETLKQMLLDDEIVSNSRLTIGSGNTFKVRPRSNPIVVNKPQAKGHQLKPADKLETGYINFKTSRFSEEPKKGYTKIEYQKATEQVTIEVDSEMMDKLRELGLLK